MDTCCPFLHYDLKQDAMFLQMRFTVVVFAG